MKLKNTNFLLITPRISTSDPDYFSSVRNLLQKYPFFVVHDDFIVIRPFVMADGEGLLCRLLNMQHDLELITTPFKIEFEYETAEMVVTIK
jgi:hypothetical protein